MEQIATDWANYLAENNLFKHSSKRPGNLFMAPYKPREYCTEALKWMYTEEKLYNYSRPGYQPRAGHFTQVSFKSKNRKHPSFHPSLSAASRRTINCHNHFGFFLYLDNLEKHERDWRSVGISQGRQASSRYQVQPHGKLCQRQRFQSQRFPATSAHDNCAHDNCVHDNCAQDNCAHIKRTRDE